MAERTNPHADIIVGAQDKATPVFDKIKGSAAGMAQGVEQSATKAGQAVGKIGDNAIPAAGKVDNATKSIIGSIERATAAMKAGERGTASYFEALAKQRNVSADAIRPYVEELRRAEAAQRAATQGIHEMSSATAMASRQFSALGGAIAGAFSVRAFVTASDAVTQLNNQLRLATGSTQDAASA